MNRTTARRGTLIVATLLIATAGVSEAGGPGVIRDGGVAPSSANVDSGSALVQLAGDPLATSTKVNRGKKNRIDLNGAATKSYRAQLSAQRNAFKRWLQANAPKAQITGSYDIAVNAVAVKLNGTQLSTLRQAPGVTSAEMQAIFRKMDTNPVDPDLALINALEAWNAVGGSANAGAGVNVAIIDSGIDEDHPCFLGTDTDDGNKTLTNNKVIVAKVFYNKAAKGNLTAEAIDSHGTHVAGTVACDVGTEAIVDGVTIPHAIAGVAPAAKLGNYNVFPGTLDSARDEDILDALEAAYADGMDVANMSLGGGYRGMQDLTSKAVDNLDRAGMIIAVAAGNDGPGFSTVGSPGRAERALTAGASSVPHTVLNPLTVGETTLEAVLGEFGVPTYPFTGKLAVVTGPDVSPIVTGVALACGPLTAASDTNQIAVIARGVCDFAVKMRNVQAAKYIGAVVVNRLEGVSVMGGSGVDDATIPGVMVTLSDLPTLQTAAANGTTVSLNAPAYRNPFGTANKMADFSSEGPTRVDRLIKPDVVAPGVNVLSSIPGGGFAFFNGTSMATPHLAGAAAVVLAKHPTWQPWQVRSAIVNTADDDALTPFHDNPADDPNLVGAGLLDLPAALGATVFASQVSVSFGAVPSGSGQTVTRQVQFSGASGTATNVSVTFEDATQTGWFAATAQNGTVTLTASIPKGAPAGGAWATLVVNLGNNEVAHLRVYVLIT